jgi:transcriptional regulator NrdR family protein
MHATVGETFISRGGMRHLQPNLCVEFMARSSSPVTAIHCPVCQSPSRVLETRALEADKVVRRRRICDNGHRYTTWEFVTADFVRKREGSLEPFDEDKLRRSIAKATADDAGVNPDVLLGDIYAAMRSAPARNGDAITTVEVGTMVLRALHEQDPTGISALRYGSVFFRDRHFDSRDELLEAIDEIRDPMLFVAKRMDQGLQDRVEGTGSVEPFNYRKLRRSLKRALEKTPTADNVERILELVASDAREAARTVEDASGVERREVDAHAIGEFVLRRLRQVDFAAYLRFLSAFNRPRFDSLTASLADEAIELPVPRSQLPLLKEQADTQSQEAQALAPTRALPS